MEAALEGLSLSRCLMLNVVLLHAAAPCEGVFLRGETALAFLRKLLKAIRRDGTAKAASGSGFDYFGVLASFCDIGNHVARRHGGPREGGRFIEFLALCELAHPLGHEAPSRWALGGRSDWRACLAFAD